MRRQASGQKPLTEKLARSRWPAAMRVLVCRERPHPCAQLDAFEDRIRQAHDAGLGRLPSRTFAINMWLELAPTAADLLARTQTSLRGHAPELAKAE
jgi:hypothetical protein